MAIIRAQRLFVSTASGLADPPVGNRATAAENSGVQPLATTVYTCPVGSRAIMRTLTASLTAPPDPEWPLPVYQCDLAPAQGGNYIIRAYYFVQMGWPAESVSWHDTWNAQIVLYEYDSLTITNLTPVGLHVSGHGHVLPLNT